jgi:predicted transporter
MNSCAIAHPDWIAMSTHQPSTATDRETLRGVALLVGLTFLLVGILGFVPGVTTNVDDLDFAGHHSGAELFDIFQVSILHNIVHLVFGVAGLVMARRVDTARIYLVGGGAIYLVLWLYGLVIDLTSHANFVPVNDADNWLHFALGVGMVGLGLLIGRKREEGRSGTARHHP